MAIDGFLTRSVRDTAHLLDACHGSDLGAPYAAPPLRKGFAAALKTSPGQLRIALCDTRLDGSAIDSACSRATSAA